MAILVNSMKILEMLVDEPDGARVTDLADRLGVNRAIPHRILGELRTLGYVVQDEATERYRATHAIGSLGLRQLEAAGTLNWAQDELRQLADSSRELVRVSIATAGRLQFVAQEQGAHSSLVVHSPLRSELPLHATASGKAWLATWPDEAIQHLLDENGLERFTTATVVDRARLLAELHNVRATGVALVCEEYELGVNAIAAPITPGNDGIGQAVGAVSIAGPSVRLDRKRLLEISPELIETAGRLGSLWHVYMHLRQRDKVVPEESFVR